MFIGLHYAKAENEETGKIETISTVNGKYHGNFVSIPEGHRWYACCKAALDAGKTEAEYVNKT